MRCPFCGDQESKVVDSRHSEDGLSIRRRRECSRCQHRFTTYEMVENEKELEAIAKIFAELMDDEVDFQF